MPALLLPQPRKHICLPRSVPLLGWLLSHLFVSVWLFSPPPAYSGGACSLDCFTNKNGKVLALTALQFHYEIDGHFDKDEQGWCASRIAIQIAPNGEVTLRDWYDANGHILSDLHYQGRVIAQTGQILTLQLEGRRFNAHLGADSAGRVRLDLQTGRLKPARTQI